MSKKDAFQKAFRGQLRKECPIAPEVQAAKTYWQKSLHLNERIRSLKCQYTQAKCFF